MTKSNLTKRNLTKIAAGMFLTVFMAFQAVLFFGNSTLIYAGEEGGGGKTCKVSFDPNGGYKGKVDPDNDPYTIEILQGDSLDNWPGKLSEAEKPTRHDFEFQGWGEAADSTEPVSLSDKTIDEDTTFYAIWKRIGYEHTTVHVDGGEVKIMNAYKPLKYQSFEHTIEIPETAWDSSVSDKKAGKYISLTDDFYKDIFGKDFTSVKDEATFKQYLIEFFVENVNQQSTKTDTDTDKNFTYVMQRAIVDSGADLTNGVEVYDDSIYSLTGLQTSGDKTMDIVAGRRSLRAQAHTYYVTGVTYEITKKTATAPAQLTIQWTFELFEGAIKDGEGAKIQSAPGADQIYIYNIGTDTLDESYDGN